VEGGHALSIALWRSMAISGPNGRTLPEIDAEGRLKNWV
jgi:hypothetical protein